MFITIKKNPTVFARNEDLFVVVRTFETHLYLISEVTTACFSTSLLVIHEQGSQHSRRGTSDKQRRRSNTRLSYIVLLYCDFFAFQSAMTPTPLKKKLDFWYMMLKISRVFLSLSRLSSSLLCWWIQERYISPSISSIFKYFLLSWHRSCSHFTKRVPVGKSVSQRSTSNQFLNKIHRVYIFFILLGLIFNQRLPMSKLCDIH